MQPCRIRCLAGSPRALLGACALALAVTLSVSGCASHGAVSEPIRVVDDAHSGGSALAVSPDSRLGASGGWSGRIRLWRLPEGSAVASWRTPHGELSGLMFLPDGQNLLSTGYDGLIRIWDLNGRLVAAYNTGSPVASFYPAKDARHVLLGHTNGVASYWTVGGTRLASWKLSDRLISAVASNAGATWFAAADSGRRVWRWGENTSPRQLQSPPTYVRSLVFNPVDNELVGSGWFDLFSWVADSSRLRVISTAHKGIVNHLAFSADGSYLASISRQTDSSILLLNPLTGETLMAFRKHALCGQRVALSPDGRSMISNSDDASVRFYLLPTNPGSSDIHASVEPSPHVISPHRSIGVF